MIEILEKNRCCGCAACYSICPQGAITMQLDKEGFEYPIISQDICVDCGLCKKVCPVLQYEHKHDIRKANNTVQTGYVARNKNFDQRLTSSSGSIFPPIAEWILEQGGIVVGIAFDESYNAVHKIIDSKEQLYLLQGSKYLQCKADYETFRIIRSELNAGRMILYSAMACQVEGLKSFLRKEYNNLYTIDLICMGIPSYVVWQKYLKTYFKGERIKFVNFKDKSIGWDSFTFRIDTDKRIFKERGMSNTYLRSMFLSWNMRPSCFVCPFKKEERISDFTIADAWGVSKYTPEINDNKGLSSVVIHSRKGIQLWYKITSFVDMVEVSIDDITEGNPNINSNKPQTGNRKLFYDTLKNNPKRAFSELCAEQKQSVVRKFIYILKRIALMLFK